MPLKLWTELTTCFLIYFVFILLPFGYIFSQKRGAFFFLIPKKYRNLSYMVKVSLSFLVNCKCFLLNVILKLRNFVYSKIVWKSTNWLKNFKWSYVVKVYNKIVCCFVTNLWKLISLPKLKKKWSLMNYNSLVLH